MVSTSKILTVSYGTFSCTLEGFDEPFNTMKSIAEYFRDLAADDRYFGAEPPTPDAEMLHRIAEREIHKRVEARVENDEIVLRQADADAPRIKPAAATLIPGETLLDQDDAPAKTPVTTAPTQPLVRKDKAPVADVQDDARDDMPTADQPADSIAAKLQRIRAVVDRGHEHDHTDEYVEDQNADAFFADPTPSHDAAPVDDETIDEISVDAPTAPAAPAVEPTETDIAAETEDEIVDEIVEDDLVEDDLAEDDTSNETEIESASDAEDHIEGVAEEARLDDEVEAISDALDDTEVEDEAYDETYEEEADGDDATLAALLGSISDETSDEIIDEGQPEEEAEAAFDADADDADDEGGIDSVLAGLVAEGAQSDDEPADEDEIEETKLADEIDANDDIALGDDIDAIADDEHENVFAEDDSDADDVEVEEIAEEEAPRPIAIARVVKVKRADLEPVEKQDNEDSLLTPEEEADLMAELAEVERDAADEDDQADQRPAFEDAGFDESDVAVDRILAETNTQMESTDVSRRRSAIAHLKAAVQAKRADEEAGDAGDDDDTEAYRDDLARVVRPRRPDTGDKHAPRRLAPLMLVSEQRIDAPEAEDTAPVAAVRPRRVTKGNLALEAEEADAEAQVETPDNGADFATFAEQSGAQGIVELLEAAAAFAIHVEGRPHFARPQIMKQVLAYDPDGTFSREKGLRAFGILLREGRIKKIKRGQFVINEATRFDPEVQRESA